jgi:(p)ppGpp synthase/HD superfamily hydrolase
VDKADKALLTRHFDDALVYASLVHGGQRRKGTDIPYIAHLLGVVSLVLEDGGDETEAIAALLHDAGGDQGGAPRVGDIRGRFGDRVANIVAACSDSDAVDPREKPPWRERKEKYLAHLRSCPPDVLRVSAADKLHNARAILTDYRRHGDALWKRFNAEGADQLWYYRSLVNTFRQMRPGPLTDELAVSLVNWSASWGLGAAAETSRLPFA